LKNKPDYKKEIGCLEKLKYLLPCFEKPEEKKD